MQDVQFAILGAGAMGSIVGAHLARAGHSVAMLVRERRARQIESDGLRINGLAQFSTPVRTIVDPSQLRSAEIFIVTTKAIDTAASLAPFHNARIGSAFSIQNGVMKNELLTQAFPHSHILGALANFSGELLPSGEVLFTRNVALMIGGPDARAIARIIDAAGVRSTAVDNIESQEWSKFAAWVGLAAISVITRALTWKFLLDPNAALVLVRLIRELGTLAAACKVELTDESMFPVATLCKLSEHEGVKIMHRYGDEYLANSPSHRLSTLQDLEAHRPLELDETMGYAVRTAERLGLELPLLDAFYRMSSALAALDRLQP